MSSKKIRTLDDSDVILLFLKGKEGESSRLRCNPDPKKGSILFDKMSGSLIASKGFINKTKIWIFNLHYPNIVTLQQVSGYVSSGAKMFDTKWNEITKETLESSWQKTQSSLQMGLDI